MTVLPQSRPLTVADLESMPDDGHRYELIDGTLIVSPAPTPRHQYVLAELYSRMREACPRDGGLLALFAPLDVVLGVDTSLQPDLLVTREADLTERNLPKAPLLAVEVLSPSTRLVDLNLKLARYEAAGCASYWVVDPVEPSIRAWELRDGRYVEVAAVHDEERFEATAPYSVVLVPADLAR